ncbi:hypothetical protein MMC13_004677 [Lambiella insularis]|nr:hypothetical protein [Lambiella insularis]
MRFSILLNTLLFASSAVLGQQITVSGWNSAQQSTISSDLATLWSGIASSSNFNSVASVLATATVTDSIIGQSEVPQSQAIAELNSIITGSPAWLESLPTGVQSWFSSVAIAEASIINRDAAGDAPKVLGRTTVAVGAALAVGVAMVLAL